MSARRHLAGASILLAALACGGPSNEPSLPPVLLVGIDGLDADITAELLAAGRLPNLARFAEEGTIGRLESMVPTYSPVIWTTIATGQGMDKHGIHFFNDDEGVPLTSNCREVPALWDLVSEEGRRVDCVGWWITWPAEVVHGRMVASYAAQSQAQLLWKGNLYEGLPDQTHPPDLQDEIEPFLQLAKGERAVVEQMWRAFPEPSGIPGERPQNIDRLLADLGWTLSGDLSYSAVAEYFLENDPGDLVMAYLALPDVAGHRFWRYHQPEDVYYEVEEPYRTEMADYLRLSYVEMDRLLGRMLERLPEDAHVLVVSDHGMEVNPDTRHEEESVTSGHHPDAPNGILAAMGPHVKGVGNQLENPPAYTIMDVAPLVLRLMELPIPNHWPAIAQGSRYEGLLDDAWRAEVRPRLVPSRDADFRPATPARNPGDEYSHEFIRLLKGIGYGGAGEPAENE